MNKIFAMLMILALCCGCAALKQAGEDYRSGVSAPLFDGEVSPKDEARGITDLLAPIPYVGSATPVLFPVLTTFFAWKRGRRLRKNLPYHPNPITGAWGKKIGLEWIVQGMANTISGIVEVGKDGSGLKRAWKVGVAIVVGIVTTALGSPEVNQFIMQNPQIVSAFVAISATFAGIEKELSKVQPVELEMPS